MLFFSSGVPLLFGLPPLSPFSLAVRGLLLGYTVRLPFLRVRMGPATSAPFRLAIRPFPSTLGCMGSLRPLILCFIQGPPFLLTFFPSFGFASFCRSLPRWCAPYRAFSFWGLALPTCLLLGSAPSLRPIRLSLMGSFALCLSCHSDLVLSSISLTTSLLGTQPLIVLLQSLCLLRSLIRACLCFSGRNLPFSSLPARLLLSILPVGPVSVTVSVGLAASAFGVWLPGPSIAVMRGPCRLSAGFLLPGFSLSGLSLCVLARGLYVSRLLPPLNNPFGVAPVLRYSGPVLSPFYADFP